MRPYPKAKYLSKYAYWNGEKVEITLGWTEATSWVSIKTQTGLLYVRPWQLLTEEEYKQS